MQNNGKTESSDYNLKKYTIHRKQVNVDYGI